MSGKSIMVALAAAVSLGTFALSSSDASAFGRAFASAGPHGVSGIRTAVINRGGVSPIRTAILHTGILNQGIKPFPILHPPHPHPHWWWHWHFGWRHPYWIAPVVAGGVATSYASYATAPAATSRCTCLTKEYTPQGAVVFKDVCTNEMAMNPPANAASAADTEPQMPQQPTQQGYLQPQPAQAQ
jgi:hypothetical protein